MAERLVIRSYRRVFEVDRRIYRVDRWALPVPGGVPLQGEPVPCHGVLATRWDASGAQLHRARVTGPALVAFQVPVEFRDRPRGRLLARGQADGAGPETVVIGG